MRRSGTTSAVVFRPNRQLTPKRAFWLNRHISSGIFRRIGYPGDGSSGVDEPGDTTAIVLNWSRFENVVRIATLLCQPQLDDVIAEVFVWNNNPKPLFIQVCLLPCYLCCALFEIRPYVGL